MRPTSIFMLVFFFIGCGTSSPYIDKAWKDWETSKAMLPSGFPFPVKHEIKTVDHRDYWIYDYDLTGDLEPEIRVWYFVNTQSFDTQKQEINFTISRHPFKVEWLKMGYIVTITKIDFSLSGEAEELQVYSDGKVEYLIPD